MVIRVLKHKYLFGVVKDVADQWLQTDCGLRHDGELRISRQMIDEYLEDLPIGIPRQIRFLTQNLRCADDPDRNTVEERAERFVQLVEEYQPDLIGTQECTLQWLQLIESGLSDSNDAFGCSRAGSKSGEEEWNAVFYRKERCTRMDGDSFWLSNTPRTAASKLNYNGYLSICTLALLQDAETRKSIFFGNTHLQQGQTEFYREVRARQIEILLRRLRGKEDRLAKYPGVLTGDFNGEFDEPYYSMITADLQDAKTAAINNRSAVDYSYHAYGDAQSLIDFCFLSPGRFTVLDYRVLDDQYGGYVSDQYGILVTEVLNDR